MELDGGESLLLLVLLFTLTFSCFTLLLLLLLLLANRRWLLEAVGLPTDELCCSLDT